MKKVLLKAAFYAMLCIAIISCKKDVSPEPIDPDTLRVLSISQLKDMNSGTMKAKVNIPAVVMSSAESIGATTFTIQDGNEPKDGILIDAKVSHNFAVGDKVILSMNGCEFNKDNGFCTIILPNSSYITKETSGASPFDAVMIDCNQLNSGNFQSMYVGLKDFEVIEEQLSEKMGTTLLFINKNKDTIFVVTPSSASFAQNNVPDHSGTIKGIVSYRNGKYILCPQSASDFDLHDKRFKVGGKNNAIIVWSDGSAIDTYISEISNNEMDNAVSLDENGTHPANCFIINDPGIYSFSAKDPTGAYPAGIPDDTQIYLNVKEIGGNTVVGYIDDDTKQILWTWHIWTSSVSLEEMSLTRKTVATDNNLSITRSIVMLDRLLGANSIAPGTVGPHGLYYQWGRKDPLIGVSIIGEWASSEKESESELGGNATAASSINQNYVSDWAYDKGSDATLTHHGAAAVPTTFITANYPSLTDTEWSDIANPCPYGYHVPNIDESRAILGVNSSVTYGGLGLVYNADGITEGMDIAMNLGFTLKNLNVWFPNNGDRANKKGRLLNLGRNYYSWCNTLNGNSGYTTQVTSTLLNPAGSFNRGNATGVRCVRNYQEK